MEETTKKKREPRFFCEICDYKCYMKCDWEKHLSTEKHINKITNTPKEKSTKKKTKNMNCYICECGKVYQNHSGFWKHSKKCTISQNKKEHDNDSNEDEDEHQENTVIEKITLPLIVKDIKLIWLSLLEQQIQIDELKNIIYSQNNEIENLLMLTKKQNSNNVEI